MTYKNLRTYTGLIIFLISISIVVVKCFQFFLYEKLLKLILWESAWSLWEKEKNKFNW